MKYLKNCEMSILNLHIDMKIKMIKILGNSGNSPLDNETEEWGGNGEGYYH